MEEDDDVAALDELKAYLTDNVLYHLWRSTPFHSWPCAVWQQKSPCTWDSLRSHGLIPANHFLIEDDPEDVV